CFSSVKSFEVKRNDSQDGTTPGGESSPSRTARQSKEVDIQPRSLSHAAACSTAHSHGRGRGLVLRAFGTSCRREFHHRFWLQWATRLLLRRTRAGLLQGRTA